MFLALLAEDDLFVDNLIPVLAARRIRIAHNEQTLEGLSAQAFRRSFGPSA